MRILDDLNGVLDDIETQDAWAYHVVTNIAERKENDPDYELSGKQFEKLNEIHRRFVKRWQDNP